MWRKLFRRASDDPSVFIICGGRRTGTTLLAAVLSSDARANPLGQEAQILGRVIEAYRWGRENFEQFGGSFFGDLETYRAFFESTAARFAREVSTRVSPGGVLILKNPLFAGFLLDVADLFPGALVLATVRDPRDQVASELEVGVRQKAAGMHVPHIDQRDMVCLANYYAGYYPEIIELRRRRPDRIYIIRYEDLVLHPDEVLADLRHATGLALTFDPTKSWTRVSSLAGLQSGPSRSDLYGGPIDARSVGRYERDLTGEEVAVVEEVAADLMAEFGYQRL